MIVDVIIKILSNITKANSFHSNSESGLISSIRSIGTIYVLILYYPDNLVMMFILWKFDEIFLKFKTSIVCLLYIFLSFLIYAIFLIALLTINDS